MIFLLCFLLYCEVVHIKFGQQHKTLTSLVQITSTKDTVNEKVICRTNNKVLLHLTGFCLVDPLNKAPFPIVVDFLCKIISIQRVALKFVCFDKFLLWYLWPSQFVRERETLTCSSLEKSKVWLERGDCYNSFTVDACIIFLVGRGEIATSVSPFPRVSRYLVMKASFFSIPNSHVTRGRRKKANDMSWW